MFYSAEHRFSTRWEGMTVHGITAVCILSTKRSKDNTGTRNGEVINLKLVFIIFGQKITPRSKV